jgi:hypothetical protein
MENLYLGIGAIIFVSLIAILFVGFQLKERLDKIAGLLEKK